MHLEVSWIGVYLNIRCYHSFLARQGIKELLVYIFEGVLYLDILPRVIEDILQHFYCVIYFYDPLRFGSHILVLVYVQNSVFFAVVIFVLVFWYLIANNQRTQLALPQRKNTVHIHGSRIFSLQCFLNIDKNLSKISIAYFYRFRLDNISHKKEDLIHSINPIVDQIAAVLVFLAYRAK